MKRKNTNNDRNRPVTTSQKLGANKKKEKKQNVEYTFSRIFGIFLGGIYTFRHLLEDHSITRHEDWNKSELITDTLKTSKETLEASLFLRLILCSLLFSKRPKQQCRTYFSKNDFEKTWKSLLALPLLEATNSLDIVVHSNNISSVDSFKKIFPTFLQAKGTAPGQFYSLLIDNTATDSESWADDEDVLCVSSGCYTIYQDVSSFEFFEYHKGRGKAQEVENILKKCPIEFMTNTKTLDAFHVLLVGAKLNFLSMLYGMDFILPIHDIGMSIRKIKKNNQLTTKIVRSQTNNFEEREIELEQRKNVELAKQKENERQLEKIKELEKQNEFERQKEYERQKECERQLEKIKELERLLEKQSEFERQKETEIQRFEKQNEFERRKEIERQQLEKQKCLQVQQEHDRELTNLKREMSKKDGEFQLLNKLLLEKREGVRRKR